MKINFNLNTCSNLNYPKNSKKAPAITFTGYDEFKGKYYVFPNIYQAKDELHDYIYGDITNQGEKKSREIYEKLFTSKEARPQDVQNNAKFKKFFKVRHAPKDMIVPANYGKLHPPTPKERLVALLQRMIQPLTTLSCGNERPYRDADSLRQWRPNGNILFSEDKKMAEDIIECLEFCSKFESINYALEPTGLEYTYNPYERMFKCDFITVEPKSSDIKDVKQSFIDALKTAKEKFEKTGRTTVLHMKELERLLSTKENNPESLKETLDYMGRAGMEYRTICLFSITNVDECCQEAFESINEIFYGNDSNTKDIKREDVDELLKLKEEFQTTTDYMTELFKQKSPEFYELRKQIPKCEETYMTQEKILEELYKKPEQNKKEILKLIGNPEVIEPKRIEIDFPTIPPQPPEPPETKTFLEKAQMFIKSNKKLLGIGAALVAFCGVGIVLYKKNKKDNVSKPATINAQKETPKPNTPAQNTYTLPPAPSPLKAPNMDEFLNSKVK